MAFPKINMYFKWVNDSNPHLSSNLKSTHFYIPNSDQYKKYHEPPLFCSLVCQLPFPKYQCSVYNVWEAYLFQPTIWWNNDKSSVWIYQDITLSLIRRKVSGLLWKNPAQILLADVVDCISVNCHIAQYQVIWNLEFQQLK